MQSSWDGKEVAIEESFTWGICGVLVDDMMQHRLGILCDLCPADLGAY